MAKMTDDQRKRLQEAKKRQEEAQKENEALGQRSFHSFISGLIKNIKGKK